MVVGFVDVRVVVEVLLHMNHVVSVLGEFPANLPRVVGLVAGHVVAVQDGGESCDVQGEYVELAGGGSQGWNACGKDKMKGSHCYCRLTLCWTGKLRWLLA